MILLLNLKEEDIVLSIMNISNTYGFILFLLSRSNLDFNEVKKIMEKYIKIRSNILSHILVNTEENINKHNRNFIHLPGMFNRLVNYLKLSNLIVKNEEFEKNEEIIKNALSNKIICVLQICKNMLDDTVEATHKSLKLSGKINLVKLFKNCKFKKNIIIDKDFNIDKIKDFAIKNIEYLEYSNSAYTVYNEEDLTKIFNLDNFKYKDFSNIVISIKLLTEEKDKIILDNFKEAIKSNNLFTIHDLFDIDLFNYLPYDIYCDKIIQEKTISNTIFRINSEYNSYINRQDLADNKNRNENLGVIKKTSTNKQNCTNNKDKNNNLQLNKNLGISKKNLNNQRREHLIKSIQSCFHNFLKIYYDVKLIEFILCLEYMTDDILIYIFTTADLIFYKNFVNNKDKVNKLIDKLESKKHKAASVFFAASLLYYTGQTIDSIELMSNDSYTIYSKYRKSAIYKINYSTLIHNQEYEYMDACSPILLFFITPIEYLNEFFRAVNNNIENNKFLIQHTLNKLLSHPSFEYIIDHVYNNESQNIIKFSEEQMKYIALIFNHIQRIDKKKYEKIMHTKFIIGNKPEFESVTKKSDDNILSARSNDVVLKTINNHINKTLSTILNLYYVNIGRLDLGSFCEKYKLKINTQ